MWNRNLRLTTIEKQIIFWVMETVYHNYHNEKKNSAVSACTNFSTLAFVGYLVYYSLISLQRHRSEIISYFIPSLRNITYQVILLNQKKSSYGKMCVKDLRCFNCINFRKYHRSSMTCFHWNSIKIHCPSYEYTPTPMRWPNTGNFQ